MPELPGVLLRILARMPCIESSMDFPPGCRRASRKPLGSDLRFRRFRYRTAGCAGKSIPFLAIFTLAVLECHVHGALVGWQSAGTCS